MMGSTRAAWASALAFLVSMDEARAFSITGLPSFTPRIFAAARAGGPVGEREFAIRLHHKDHDELRLVLLAFDGFVDETLDRVRQAERGWWSSEFDVLALQALHAAAISGAVVITGIQHRQGHS